MTDRNLDGTSMTSRLVRVIACVSLAIAGALVTAAVPAAAATTTLAPGHAAACTAPVSRSNGAYLRQVRCPDTPLWSDQLNDDGSHTFVVAATLRDARPKCIDTENGLTSAGTPLVAGWCTGSATQRWHPSSAHAWINAAARSFCMTGNAVPDHAGNYRDVLQVCRGTTTQSFVPIYRVATVTMRLWRGFVVHVVGSDVVGARYDVTTSKGVTLRPGRYTVATYPSHSPPGCAFIVDPGASTGPDVPNYDGSLTVSNGAAMTYVERSTWRVDRNPNICAPS